MIQDHLELKERNSELDPVMPLDRYTTEDPFGNHPLFKSEEQARIEETLDGTEPAVALVSPPAALAGRRDAPTSRNTASTTASGAGRGSSTGATEPRPRLAW